MLRRLWVAAYDLSDDRQRYRLEKLLSSQGTRTQFSVFELWHSDREHQRLRTMLANNIRLVAETDSLRWYGLCNRCQSHVHFAGRGLAAGDPRFFIV